VISGTEKGKGMDTVALAAAGAGFVGLLSLFNLLGRFFWSSASDKLGRKSVYLIYFGLGVVLYALAPTLGLNGQLTLFVVGAIHGRLLTAWSTAGVLGPLIVHSLSEGRKAAGFTGAAAYQTVFYTMAGLLAVGFLADLAVTAVKDKYYEKGPVTIEAGGH
nr:hypothetical protein [Tanacetum cinerariifolium]